MKTVVITLALIPVGIMAQRRPPMPAMRVPGSAMRAPVAVTVPGSVGALGGGFLSPGFSRPLGGITPAKTPVVRTPLRNQRYFGPVYYVPNAFYTYSNYDSPTAEARAERRAAASQPVVVNQYFGSNEADYAHTEFNSSTSRNVNEPPPPPGDPIGPQENYYLIEYKDHSIYSALAYWVEDGTLHYVTTQNTHNQASLGLIDVEKTTKLNADHAVPFSISR